MPNAFDYEAAGLLAPCARPRIPDGPQSVAELLDATLARASSREALVDRHRRYSYEELDRAVNRAAHALGALGVGPSDRVAMSIANATELVVAFLATQRLGAVWVGINRILAAREKAFILRDAGVSVLLADAEIAAEIEPCRDALPALRHVVVVSPGNAACAWAALTAAASEARARVEIDPFAPAAIAYTSGTTGFPKGAVHTQHNLVLIGAMHGSLGELDADTRHGCLLPLTILNLMVLQPLIAFRMGACAICIDRADAVMLADFIRRERIGHFSGVPTILHDLLTKPEIRAEDLRTLRRPLVGGAEIPEALCTMYKERFGSEVLVGYGMTEAPTAVTMTDGHSAWRPGLCGRPLPHVRIDIVDGEDRALGRGEVGEICVAPADAGPFAGVYTPMLGYWNNPDATRTALRGGRFHTGDLGAFADDGCLYIKGRLNDLILRGGANVYPAEVERVLQEDPRVAACAVLGKPDERLGERVIAVVELTAGASATSDELRAHCAASLARYKVPDEIVFLAELPRNAMRKVQKRELRAQLKLE